MKQTIIDDVTRLSFLWTRKIFKKQQQTEWKKLM